MALFCSNPPPPLEDQPAPAVATNRRARRHAAVTAEHRLRALLDRPPPHRATDADTDAPPALFHDIPSTNNVWVGPPGADTSLVTHVLLTRAVAAAIEAIPLPDSQVVPTAHSWVDERALAPLDAREALETTRHGPREPFPTGAPLHRATHTGAPEWCRSTGDAAT